MKKVTLITIALLGIAIAGKAQNVNYKDSLKKYQDIARIFYLKGIDPLNASGKSLYYFDNLSFFTKKVDSLINSQNLTYINKRKKQVEKKYNIKLD